MILNLFIAHLFEIVFVEEQENGDTEPFSIGNEVEKHQELKLISLIDQVQVVLGPAKLQQVAQPEEK